MIYESVFLLHAVAMTVLCVRFLIEDVRVYRCQMNSSVCLSLALGVVSVLVSCLRSSHPSSLVSFGHVLVVGLSR